HVSIAGGGIRPAAGAIPARRRGTRRQIHAGRRPASQCRRPAAPARKRVGTPGAAAGAMSMINRVWLKSYPPEVPHDIDPGQLASLTELICDALRRHADQTAYVLLGHAVTYREVDRMSAAFAAWLQSRGLKKGDRIALMLPNVLQYPVAMFGAQRAGLIVVNTNPLYTADELRHQMQDSGATAILVLENFAHTVQSVLADTQLKHVIVTGVGALIPGIKGWAVDCVLRHVKRQLPDWTIPQAFRLKAILQEFEGRTPQPVELGHSDIAFLQYTGGTTGVAKGAML